MDVFKPLKLYIPVKPACILDMQTLKDAASTPTNFTSYIHRGSVTEYREHAAAVTRTDSPLLCGPTTHGIISGRSARVQKAASKVP